MARGSRPRFALLFAQFSAYHIDRCEAVAARLGDRFEVLAVEVATSSETYAWDPSGEVAGARKLTLFQGANYDRIHWLRRLWAQFFALWRCRVVLVGIGYNEPDVVVLSWLLAFCGVRVVMMTDSKFDDKPRRTGFELFKSAILSPYSSAIVSGRRQFEYLRYLGFRRRRVVHGYGTVGLDRVLTMGGGVPAPGGAPFADRPFVFVGRFVAKKNLAGLLSGYALYRAACGDKARKLVLVGGGPEEAALRQQVRDLDLEHKIEFAGFLGAEAVAQRLAGALALVLVSREEQWGLVANEAIAFHLPMIVSEAVGSRDALVRNLVNGFVVQTGCDESLAHAMQTMAGDEAGWRSMVAASAERRWMGDAERLVDAVEVLCGTGDAASRDRISRFAALLEDDRSRIVPNPSGKICAATETPPDPIEVEQYWNEFYSRSGAPAKPSAFAIMVGERWSDPVEVVDVGCGNGRDSAHFLALGKSVTGLDSCPEAIAACNRNVAARFADGPARASFVAVPASDPALWDQLAKAQGGPVLVYARFFFHAVPDDTEAAVLSLVGALLRRRGGLLCAEFRTPRDEPLVKALPAHYRRYVDPDAFCARLTAQGLKVIERFEGQGMAVFGDEDAYVARIVACR